MTVNNVLINEIEQSMGKSPFVYEVFKGNLTQNEMEQYLNKIGDNIIVRYDANNNNQEYVITTFLNTVFEHFKLEAPSIPVSICMGMAKVSLGVSSLAFPIVAPLLSIVSAGITLYELDINYQERKNKEERAVKILNKFKENQKFLETSEGLLLASISLLMEITCLHKIIINIENTESLKPIDIQFLRLYYSLFKDKPSRLQIGNMVSKSLRLSNGEAKSDLLTILNWNFKNSNELDTYTVKEGISNDIKQLVEFRWLLYRYKMAAAMNTTTPLEVVNEDIFVGRGLVLKQLISEINQVGSEGILIASKIQAPAGTGKTSLSTQLVNQLNLELDNTEYIYTSFGGEHSTLKEGLCELRDSFQYLKLKLDSSVRTKLSRLIKFDKNERLKGLSELFDRTATTDSFLSMAATLLGLEINAVVDTVKTSIFASRDGLGALKDATSGKGNSPSQINIEQAVHTSQINLREVVEQLVQEYIGIFKNLITKKVKKTLVWVVDDTQWMDYGSSLFFKMLFEELKSSLYPVYILFLERPEASSTRPELKSLNSYFSNIVSLDGFTKEEIQILLEAAITNNGDTNEVSAVVSNIMWNWFCTQEDKLSIEPLFVVEFVNLLAYQSDILEQRGNYRWRWASSNKFIISKLLNALVKEWSESNAIQTSLDQPIQFTKSALAVMNERMYQISRNYKNGEDLVYFLQLAAFFGEPFQPNIINKLNNKENFSELYLKEFETTYRILIETNFESSGIMYLFSHALYYEYLLIRYRHFCTISLEEQHFNVYNILKTELNENPLKSINIREVILLQAANHGSQSNKEKAIIQSAHFLGELAEISLQQFRYDKVFEYADRAKTIADKYMNPSHSFTHKIINLMVIGHITVGDKTTALSYLNSQIANIDKIKRKRLKSLNKIDPVQLAISYTIRSEILVDTAFQFSDLEFRLYEQDKEKIIKEAENNINRAINILNSLNLNKKSTIELHISHAYQTRGKINRYKVQAEQIDPDICIKDYEKAIYWMNLAVEKNDMYRNYLFELHKVQAYIQEEIFSLIMLKDYNSVNIDKDPEEVVIPFNFFTSEKIIPQLNEALEIAYELEREGNFIFPNAVMFEIQKRASYYTKIRNFTQAENDIDLIFSRANELLSSGRLNKSGTSILTLNHLLAAKITLLKWFKGFEWNYDYFERNLLRAAYYADQLHHINYLVRINSEIQHSIQYLAEFIGLKVLPGEYFKTLEKNKNLFREKISLQRIDTILNRFHPTI